MENSASKREQNQFRCEMKPQDSFESIKKYFHFLIINIILLTSSAKKGRERERGAAEPSREAETLPEPSRAKPHRNQNNARLKYEPRKL